MDKKTIFDKLVGTMNALNELNVIGCSKHIF